MKDLSLHILDIVQNSISAKATLIEIEVNEQPNNDTLTITITDNGKGMTPEQVIKVTDPYFTSRTSRKVGLGIPLFKQNAEQSGGKLSIISTIDVGTQIIAQFGYSHIDRPALGNIANAISLLVMSNPAIDFIYTHTINKESYLFDTREVKEILGDTPINNTQVVKMVEGMIAENINDLQQNSNK
ncbi:MAG: ATP-binding protein [Prevotellaceae bacterium]|jgi:hypothetical protein|nr:ATP-binding protein [Prevotellaceae bacterium]